MILAAGLLLSSCSNEKKEKDFALQTIPSSNLQDMDPEEIFEQNQIINLDFCDDCIIGDIDKILIDDTGLYILDKQVTKSLKKFNWEGKLIFNINEIGEGLGKFVLPFDFDLEDETLLILDVNQRKMLKFNSNNGTFIQEKRIGEFQAVRFASLGKEAVAYHLDGREFGEGMHYLGKIVNYNNEDKNSKHLYDYGNSDYMTVDQEFTKGKTGILFAKSMNDTIYSVDIEGFHPKYLLDFGKKRLDESIKNSDIFEAREKIMSNWPHFHWGRMFENSNYLIYLLSGDQGKKSLAYYSKESKRTSRLNGPSFFPLNIFYLDDSRLMAYITPEEYLEYDIEGIEKEYRNPIIVTYRIVK